MRKAAWEARLEQLAALKQRTREAAVNARTHSESLHDWLEHQKALLAIGASNKCCSCCSALCICRVTACRGCHMTWMAEPK